jgi:hypothetical protein
MNMVNGKRPEFGMHDDPVEQAMEEQKQELPLFKCFLSDWFMATREDAKEYHCAKLGHDTQCDYCRGKEEEPTLGFVFNYNDGRCGWE